MNASHLFFHSYPTNALKIKVIKKINEKRNSISNFQFLTIFKFILYFSFIFHSSTQINTFFVFMPFCYKCCVNVTRHQIKVAAINDRSILTNCIFCEVKSFLCVQIKHICLYIMTVCWIDGKTNIYTILLLLCAIYLVWSRGEYLKCDQLHWPPYKRLHKDWMSLKVNGKESSFDKDYIFMVIINIT